ncbi:hypothetical protein Salat_2248600 [Sesamum alatum]|uniref:Pentatricopeptide repeat-containing protein n=1 Tax=Sesamum alatum TaxID=300844 RepID=A0AAE1XUP0_9LAMI|nr:hypothetical protein Salat_2248600 [Sesamum alatum]
MVSRTSCRYAASATAPLVSTPSERGMLSTIFIHPKSRTRPQNPLQKSPRNDGKMHADDALAQFDKMLMQTQPPVSSFNTLLGAVAKAKKYEDLFSMFNRMAEANLLPDYIGMNILINSYCDLKRVGLGFAVMGGMLKRGYDPNIVTYTSLIKGLCVEDKIGDAVGLLKKIIRMGVHPNVKTWGTLVTGLCRSGNAEVALRMHEELVKGNVGFGVSLISPEIPVSYVNSPSLATIFEQAKNKKNKKMERDAPVHLLNALNSIFCRDQMDKT